MRITIVKCSSLGDIVQALPVAAFLKKTLPGVTLAWVCEQSFASLVSSCSQIDDVLTIDSKLWRKKWLSKESWRNFFCCFSTLRSHKSDLVIDLQGNTKSALITAILPSARKVGFGKKNIAERPALWVTHEQYHPPAGGNIRLDYLLLAAHAIGLQEVDHELFSIELKAADQRQDQLHAMIYEKRKEGKGIALIAPFSFWPNKQLADQQIKTFILHLQNRHNLFSFLLWGSEEEKKKALLLAEATGSALLPSKYSAAQLQQIIALADLLIAMDSLPLHLAAATNTPTYSFFGPSLASKYAPLGSRRHGYLQGSCPYGLAFDKRCPKLRSCASGACLKTLAPSYIQEHFDSFWLALNGGIELFR